ncbi:VF530 family protein [soil metagenome]
MSDEQPKNPLHGIKLEQIVSELVAHYGWERLAEELRFNSLATSPTVKSTLKFLRKTPWARDKTESFYLFMQREKKRSR